MKRWSQREKDQLLKFYSDGYSINFIIKKMNRTKNSITSCLFRLNNKSDRVKPWSGKEENLIREHYPDIDFLVANLDRTKAAIYIKASEMNLTKGNRNE